MTQKTGLIWNERFMWHDNGSALGQIPAGGAFQPGVHLENPETKRRLKNLLDAYDVTPQLSRLAHTAATRQTLERFHTADYIDLVAHMSQTTGGSVGQSTIAGPGSYDIARLAVGGTTAAIKDVMAGAVSNAYALTRPPGHHAERDRGRGFCIFNNIALAILEAGRWAGLIGWPLSIGMCIMATAHNKRFLRTPMSSPSPSIKRCSTR